MKDPWKEQIEFNNVLSERIDGVRDYLLDKLNHLQKQNKELLERVNMLVVDEAACVIKKKLEDK